MNRIAPFVLFSLCSSSLFATTVSTDSVVGVVGDPANDSQIVFLPEHQTTHRFSDLRVTRMTPSIAGIKVEGADSIVVRKAGKVIRSEESAVPMVALNTFAIPRGFAVATAQEHARGALITDASVERLDILARRVYLAEKNGLRAVYRVRIPTLRLQDLNDYWVDAQSGTLLKSERVARFAGEGDPAPETANLFDYQPNPEGADNADLVEVTLPNLLGSTIGEPLCGEYITTRNCCKEYVCLDGSGECELADRRCARPDDEEPIVSTLNIEIPTDGFNAPIALPEILYAQSVVCSELPILRAEEDGYNPPPIDVTADVDPALALATEIDAFAEVQAYYTTMQYFLHTRNVLDDQTFCLAETSMLCEDDGSPTLVDGLPELPFHVTVNSLLPEIDIQVLSQQLIGGLGAEPGNPIVVDTFQRLENAAFIPAFDGGPADIPAEFQDLAEQFLRPYDSNVYFQGNRDFAYDGDVVAHEFTHAIIFKLAPNLGQFAKGTYGISAEPGALNEGLSDYFAAAFANNSVIGEYGSVGLVEPGEIGLRDLSNDKTCPNDIEGEVHFDAEPFAGALWSIRESIAEAERIVFDRALFAAISQSGDDEFFAVQAERILESMADFGVGDVDSAREEFDSRGLLTCDYTFPLSIVDDADEATLTIKERLFMASTESAGVATISPAPLQFRIEVPANTPGFVLRWKQTAAQGNGLIGSGEAVSLRVLVNEQDGAFTWQFDGEGERFATPFNPDGEEVSFNPQDADVRVTPGQPNDNGISDAIFSVDIDEVDACDKKVFYAQLITVDQGTVLSDIDVILDPPEDNECGEDPDGPAPPDEEEACACSSSGDSDASEPTGLAFVLGLAALMLRRRKR